LSASVKPPRCVVFSAFHPNSCVNGQRQVFGSVPHLVKASTKDGGTNWQQVFGALP
jgi:hypothetical protein